MEVRRGPTETPAELLKRVDREIRFRNTDLEGCDVIIADDNVDQALVGLYQKEFMRILPKEELVMTSGSPRQMHVRRAFPGELSFMERWFTW